MELKYTEAQNEAMNHRDGNLLIVACAGSGKTEVISRRIALLINGGIPKKEIVAFTFTDRAAHEFKARIRRHLEALRPSDPSLGDMYVGTIHSFCLQLLKEVDSEYRNFDVLDEVGQAAIIASNYKIRPTNKGTGIDRLRSRTRTKGYWDAIKAFTTTLNIAHIKNLDFRQNNDSDLTDTVARYHKTLKDRPNYFFDFNFIIDELIKRLLADPAILENMRNKFSYLIVDEYQDIDPRQEELINLLTDGGKRVNLTVVGDDDQAIYGWRGANIENILTFEKRYPNVKRIELINNFRSTHAIVEIANIAIRNIPTGRRLEKSMVSRSWQKKDGKDFLGETIAEYGDIIKGTFPDEESEAEWVANQIIKLRGIEISERDGKKRGANYSDFAILLRSVRSQGQSFVDAFRKNSIPFIVKGTHGLFSQDEILLVQALFCQLANVEFRYTELSGSSHSLSVIDTREFIRVTAQKLKDSNQMPLANGVLLLEWVAKKRELLERQNASKDVRQKGLSRRIRPQAIFHEMLEKLGVRDNIQPWNEIILYNLGRFSSLITKFESVHQWITPNDLFSLCIFLGGWAASNTDEGNSDEISTKNAVQILTVHAAKGLEWPIVFLPRINSSIFPSSLRNRGPETLFSAVDFDPKKFAGGDEGERRLWYVAITRCRKFLHVSSLDAHRKKPTDYYKEVVHDYMRGPDFDFGQRPRSEPKTADDIDLLPTTFSDLSYYWKCPYQYQLRALMEFSPGVSESYGYGKQLHNILAEIHLLAASGKSITPEIAGEIVESRFSLRYTTGEPETALRTAARKAICRYIELYPEHTKFTLSVEKPFEYMDKDSGALIRGTIDLLERIEQTNSGELIHTPVCIVDFKAQKWTTHDSYQQRCEEVENQLRLYAAAVKNALGFDPKAAIAQFISSHAPNADLIATGVNERLSVDVSDDKQLLVRARIKETVSNIRAGLFPQTGCDHKHCKNCDFRHLCGGYTKFLKKNELQPVSLEEGMQSDIESIIDDNLS